MKASKLRDQACICLSDFQKTKKPENFLCKCTASVIEKKYLNERQVLIENLPLTETYKLNFKRVQTVARDHPSLRKYLTKFAESIILRNQPTPPTRPPKTPPAPPSSPERNINQNMAPKKPQVDLDTYALGPAWEDVSKTLLESLGTQQALDGFMKKSFMQAYEYQGFDVVKFRDNFMKLCDTNLDETNTVWDGDNMVPVHGPENFIRLVAYLVSLFNLRGNNIDKIIDGMVDKKAAAALKTLKETLGIRSKVTEKGKPRNTMTVTLSRIAAAFPIITIQTVMNPQFKRKIIDMSDVGIEQDKPLGRVLCHPMLGSILTDEQKKKGFVYISVLASIKLNRIIGGETTKKPDYMKLWNFQKAVLCSKAASEKIRDLFWNQDGLSVIPEQLATDAAKEVKKIAGDEVFEAVRDYAGCDRD